MEVLRATPRSADRSTPVVSASSGTTRGRSAAATAAARRGCRLFALEPAQKRAQQSSELALFVRAERFQQPALVLEMQGRDPIDQGAALGGELDEEPAPVLGVGDAPHEPGALQACESMGHRARAAHQFTVKLGGGEAIRRSAAPQAGEHVEGLAREAEVGESGIDGGVGVSTGSTETGDHGRRARVEIRARCGPLRAHMVDMVCCGVGCPPGRTDVSVRRNIFKFRHLPSVYRLAPVRQRKARWSPSTPAPEVGTSARTSGQRRRGCHERIVDHAAR